MPPGRVAYPGKLDWNWPKVTVTMSAVRTQTRKKALSRAPAGNCPAWPDGMGSDATARWRAVR